MRPFAIRQTESGSFSPDRVGDVLADAISDPRHDVLKFAVAYMRLSGLNRLAVQLEDLVERGGQVSGAVGLDGGITTAEALNGLLSLSETSTVFHTVSGFIFHPKLYVVRGNDHGIVIAGSANLTCDGLYRNIELACGLDLDLTDAQDTRVMSEFEDFVDALLDPSHPNVLLLSEGTLSQLVDCGLAKPESWSREPSSTGPRTRPERRPGSDLFPPLRAPVPPPVPKSLVPVTGSSTEESAGAEAREGAERPASAAGRATTFVMQLSSFDCSHRTGVKGTPEVLIPHDAVPFFPALSMGGRKYPDAQFDVLLNTPTGKELHDYRLWYYEERATGTRIDEYRLRMDHDTIDLTVPGGGDILVVSRLSEEGMPAYEVTIVNQGKPEHSAFLALCDRESQGKRWGIH